MGIKLLAAGLTMSVALMSCGTDDEGNHRTAPTHQEPGQPPASQTTDEATSADADPADAANFPDDCPASEDIDALLGQPVTPNDEPVELYRPTEVEITCVYEFANPEDEDGFNPTSSVTSWREVFDSIDRSEAEFDYLNLPAAEPLDVGDEGFLVGAITDRPDATTSNVIVRVGARLCQSLVAGLSNESAPQVVERLKDTMIHLVTVLCSE